MVTSIDVDAHHHLWDPDRFHYPWLDRPEAAPVRRRFGPEDLAPLLAGQGVRRTVVIEARPSLDETRELLAIARSTEFVAGVVGWVDLRDPALSETLAGLRAEPDGSRLVGIRHQLPLEEPGWMALPDVVRGLRALAGAGLAYDVLAGPRELPAALSAVRQVPELTFVVDHLGGDPTDEGWAGPMAELASLPNVVCKVSGGWGALLEAGAPRLAPYVERLRDWFGEERLIFGSDWPVCTLTAPYDEVVGGWRTLLTGVAPGVFGANAVRAYRLEPSPS